MDEDEVTHEVTRTFEKDHEWGLNLIQSLSLANQNVLRFAGLYNHWIAPNGKRFYVGRRCDLETFSLSMVDEHRFGQLSIDAGLKWTKTYIDEYGAFNINGSPRGFANVQAVEDLWEPATAQGSLGAAYDLFPFLSFTFNLAAGEFRPRSGTLDINFQEPQNERRIKLDIGVRTLWQDIARISVVGFVTQQDNAIVLSGKTSEVNGRAMELYLNRDQDQLGIELEGRFGRVFNIAEAFFNTTLMASRADIDGSMQRNRELPRVIASAGIYARVNRLDLNILGKYVSEYESTRFLPRSSGNPVEPQPLGDYVTLDVTAGWTISKGYSTRFYLEIQNITDQIYSTVVGYPDFGRRMIFGVRQSFR
jgi:hypothetical protein